MRGPHNLRQHCIRAPGRLLHGPGPQAVCEVTGAQDRGRSIGLGRATLVDPGSANRSPLPPWTPLSTEDWKMNQKDLPSPVIFKKEN